jgi:hypothetical protein
MELKAFYSIEDILNLIDQDLQSKGYRQAEGCEPDTNANEYFHVVLTIEKWLDPILPAQLPVVEVSEVIHDETPTTPDTGSKRKVKGVSRIGKTPEQLEKDRVYRERWKAKQAANQQQEPEEKKPDQANAQAIIARKYASRVSQEERQAVVEQRTRDYANERGHTVWEGDFGEKVLAEIEELKKAEVVAASPVPFQD